MYQQNVEKDFRTFFYEKFQATHGGYYGGKHSLVDHFESAEVTVPVLDIFKLVDEWFTKITFKDQLVINGAPTTAPEKYIYQKNTNGKYGIAHINFRIMDTQTKINFLHAIAAVMLLSEDVRKECEIKVIEILKLINLDEKTKSDE